MSDGFAVAAAQLASRRGDLAHNLATHLRFVAAAAAEGVHLVVFPELSLTGYEPDIAAELALTVDDSRLEPLRSAAIEHGIHVLVGGPLVSGGAKPYIGAFLLSPEAAEHYAKVHVTRREARHFLPGSRVRVCVVRGVPTGIAVCADTSHAEHAAEAAAQGAALYVASVFMTAADYPVHADRMQGYGARHGMVTLTANYAGTSGGMTSAGQSACWDERGGLLARAGRSGETLVIARREGGRWRAEIVAADCAG